MTRGDLVRVFPANSDDPEALAHTGKQFRVERTRTTPAGSVLIMVSEPTGGTRIFRECDLMKVKED